jgi:hypothetical protein
VAGRKRTLEAIRTLCSILDIIPVVKADVLNAMELDMPDYEDALAELCAKRAAAECIVTRNTSATLTPQFQPWNQLPFSRGSSD